MPSTERTLVLVKPDGVQRQLIGRILARYEERGLKVVGLKLVQTSRDLAERHYAAHAERPFFGSLVDFITSSPLVALALEGPNAIAVVRAINGATQPHEAAPGHDPRRLRARDRAEHRPRVRRPRVGRGRTRPVVRGRRAALLRALRRSLGPAAGRVGRVESGRRLARDRVGRWQPGRRLRTAERPDRGQQGGQRQDQRQRRDADDPVGRVRAARSSRARRSCPAASRCGRQSTAARRLASSRRSADAQDAQVVEDRRQRRDQDDRPGADRRGRGPPARSEPRTRRTPAARPRRR